MTNSVDLDVQLTHSRFAELQRQFRDPRNQGRKRYEILLAMERLNAEHYRRTGGWLEIDEPNSKTIP